MAKETTESNPVLSLIAPRLYWNFFYVEELVANKVTFCLIIMFGCQGKLMVLTFTIYLEFVINVTEIEVWMDIRILRW